MHIEYFHASKFGNGKRVADRFAQQMQEKGVSVAIHRIDDIDPTGLPGADLYVFSSPGRMGRPIREARTFLKRLRLPADIPVAILTTEMAPQPDKKTGRMPTEEEICKFQKVRPIMHQLLQDKGAVEVAQDAVFVTDIKGPLEDGWETKVDTYADRIASALAPAGS
jgi:menaquinone-dependent protoporphyrinogen IX oxidase